MLCVQRHSDRCVFWNSKRSNSYTANPTCGEIFESSFKTQSSPPPHNQMNSRIWYAFSILKLTKFPQVYTSIRGGFHFWLHKTFLEQVRSARSSCTADARPLNGFENGPNLAENRIECVLLTSWDGNSIFFSANRARPSSQNLPLNGFMEWNFLRNKEKAYQNRE